MLKRLLTKPKKQPPSALSTLDRLHETLEMLEKKEHVLQKKISGEVEKAKDYTKAKNKKVQHQLAYDKGLIKPVMDLTSSAIQCLKKKKLYEAQIEQLGNFQLRVHDQMIVLEGAKATTDTIDALRTGSSAVKSIQQSLSIDDIEKTMEQANEHTENMRQIQEALAMPVGAAADFDEDELEAELEDLEGEELEEELLQPPSTVPATRLPNPNQPERETPRPASDVDELAALQAEMAL
ncbi:vacuolar protein sorting-associated protein 32 homolog 1 isoform X1 [Elaeis guineensis]|uniref:Vacuolar protein sorting-associated protein 32 homolog 2 isoform X1 n=1 Tax=Elaeis guineensis var. tenera TaxID=51953 RepID=A0A6I9RS08_ELAGV|nr:vacuolar protein sorting-associated protein 32 homolog 2 isoform X1 [Elaeis guineensis]